MSRASLDKDPRDVAAMFDDVASKYDVTNDVLSLGQDRLWRRAVVAACEAVPGQVVLDIAAGTGTSSEPFAYSGVDVVPADFSLGMLRVGHQRRSDLGFTAADAMHLPFADESFDVVTMSFGLRNVADPDAALREFLRVTKPGGRLVICEFLRLPRRVHPGLAGAARPGAAGVRGRLARGPVAQPFWRHRRPPPGHQADRLTAAAPRRQELGPPK